MSLSNLFWILVMAAATFAVRAAPLTLLRKPLEQPFLKSFLYYVPFVTLSVMTVPAIFEAPQSAAAGAAALLIGAAAAWLGAGLFGTAGVCCLVVLALEVVLL